jgi:restriction system protein
LKKIEWRQFEELLDAIFKNQGFYTELGTGRNDGGVDIRLYQSLAIPEIVTLVQAKRYKNPIKLEAVAALFGIAVEQKAANAIFATTSRFQPRSHQFCRSVEQRVDLPGLKLADSQKIAGWCAEIGKNLDDFFSKGLAAPPFLKDLHGPNVGLIVVAHGGHNCRTNYFARVEADLPHEAILRPVGAETVSGDWMNGAEVPSESARVTWTKNARFLAFKRKSGGYWTDIGQFYWECSAFHPWDGTPQWFNCD